MNTEAPRILSPPAEGRFRLSVPIEPTVLIKAKPKAAKEHWIIEGTASTEDTDLQDEVVVQDGIDFQPLMKQGFINWNHLEGPENIIGVPLEVKLIEGPSLYIKAELLQEVARAEAVYALARSLDDWNKSNPDKHRRLAWSIEGRKEEQEGARITRCTVDQMAVTHEPVNPFTFANLVRSLRAARKAMSTGGPAGDASLDVQNLDDGTLGLWGSCRVGHYDPDSGRFLRGVSGAMEHLVLCRGLKPHDAREMLTRLKRAY